MLKISSQEEFGLRFLLHLARAEGQVCHTEGDIVSLSEIAQKEGVSLAYVRKIFRILRLGGLVRASKGVQGGYSLLKPANDLNLKDIFDTLKTQETDFNCSYFTGNLEVCANYGDCGVRPLISLLNKKIDDFLKGINLSQLAKEEKKVMFELKKMNNEPTKTLMEIK